MNFNELTEKYRALLTENKKLKEKIKLLENQMGKKPEDGKEGAEKIISDRNQIIKSEIPADATKSKVIDKQSSPSE